MVVAASDMQFGRDGRQGEAGVYWFSDESVVARYSSQAAAYRPRPIVILKEEGKCSC